jgi:peptide deformylase
MPLRVTLFNEPILREAGEEINIFDDDLAKLCDEMIDTMYEHEGIGLAAQQIGKALMLCVIDVPQSRDSSFQFTLDGKSPPAELIMPMALINPVVETLPSTETVYEEGCLSFPGINGNVPRPEKVRVSFQDHNGDPHVMECNALLGRCVQHEVDHLNGILFIDRMDAESLKIVDSRIRKLKKETQKFLKKILVPHRL